MIEPALLRQLQLAGTLWGPLELHGECSAWSDSVDAVILYAPRSGALHLRLMDAPERTYLLFPGDLALLPAGAAHIVSNVSSAGHPVPIDGLLRRRRERQNALLRVEGVGHEPVLCMWAMQSFWRTDVIQIVKWLLPPLMVANFASGNSPLASLVEALERFGGETRNDSPLLLNLTANALVQSLISRASVPVHNGEPAHDTAAKAITCPRISIAEEASVAGMSARKLSKLFRELTGETPRTFGKAQRLRKAVSLLENGDLSVAEVAHASGYRSVTSFTKAFASVHGCPPTRWRRRRRAE